MSLYSRENIANGTTLGIWKKEEQLDLLESVFLLNSDEEIEYLKISNEPRKKEWLSTRILLTELLGLRSQIFYNEYRKPYLKNHNSNITISHSKNFIAIIVSATYIPGIDIEHISERVAKVKHKFLIGDELEWCKNLDQLTACWSAKEAIFKIYEKNLDFHDMVISPFTIDSTQGNFKASIVRENKQGSYVVKYRLIENDILTFTLSKTTLG